MAYKFFGMVALSLFLSIVTFSGEIAQERKEAPNGPGLGGVYEFVSQTVEIKSPSLCRPYVPPQNGLVCGNSRADTFPSC
jgi:hypothetical protein